MKTSFRLALGLPCCGLFLTLSMLRAVETFVPPEPYPSSRYESGWEKNPFTLKTAPVAVQKESFGKDWTLNAIGGPVNSPTVTVVNRQTHERVSLHGLDSAKNGMKLKAVHRQPSSKDSTVEVELSGDVATLAYDDTFLKTLHAAGGIGANPGALPPGASAVPHPMGTNPAAARPPGSISPVPGPPTATPIPPLPRPPVVSANQQNFSNPATHGLVNRRRYLTGPTPH